MLDNEWIKFGMENKQTNTWEKYCISIGTVTLYTACASTACKGSSQLYY